MSFRLVGVRRAVGAACSGLSRIASALKLLQSHFLRTTGALSGFSRIAASRSPSATAGQCRGLPRGERLYT